MLGGVCSGSVSAIIGVGGVDVFTAEGCVGGARVGTAWQASRASIKNEVSARWKVLSLRICGLSDKILPVIVLNMGIDVVRSDYCNIVGIVSD